MTDSPPRRVLISHSADFDGSDSDEHRAAVLDLAERLRHRGIDAWLDAYEPTPAQGRPRWITEQFDRADYVVLVCTASYRRHFEGREREGGRRAAYEGLLATQLLYERKLDYRTLVPVLLPGASEDDIPLEVRAATHHVLPREFEQLVAHLTGRLAVAPPPVNPTPAASRISPVEAPTRRFGRSWRSWRSRSWRSWQGLALAILATTVIVLALALGLGLDLTSDEPSAPLDHPLDHPSTTPGQTPEPASPLSTEHLDALPTGESRGIVATALADTEVPMQLVGLTGGRFTMGRDRERHRVSLSPFAICATEVSVAQYELVTGEKACVDQCRADHPAHDLAWQDTLRFLNRLSEREKLTQCYDETEWTWRRDCTGYRLPTDAEWEYAARAGTTTPWSFGTKAVSICKYANVSMDQCDDEFDDLAPVDSPRFEPNPWGLAQMHGNVREWVFDAHSKLDSHAAVDPVVEGASNKRVIRGGSADFGLEAARSDNRVSYEADHEDRRHGFRCARSMPAGPAGPPGEG